MATLLQRTREALASVVFSWSSSQSADTTTTAGKHKHGSKKGSGKRTGNSPIATNIDDIMKWADLSAETLRSMGGTGQILRVPITAGTNPPLLAAVKFTAHLKQQEQRHSQQHQQEQQQPSSSSSDSPSSHLDLPSQLGGAGLLGFLTSRWFVVLVVITALVNRIQHICRPRTRPQSIVGWKRVLLKLPSLILLTHSMISLLGTSVLLGDISRQFSSNGGLATGNATRPGAPMPSVAYPVGSSALLAARFLPRDWPRRAWSGDMFINPESGQYRIEARSSPYIWAAFLAAATAVVTESLIKSLEGSRDQEMPSFNLAGFAFITHAYVYSPDSQRGHPGSPTWSLFFSTFLQVAELWTLSMASLTRSRPRARLPVTSFFGIAATAHNLHWRYIGHPTDPLHIASGFPDAALLSIILLTVCLHALTMAVTEGSIDTSRLLFNASNLPNLTEDYGLALFKLGTACLESTRLSGMSRELASIRTPTGTWVEMDSSGNANVVGGVAMAGGTDAGYTTAAALGSGNRDYYNLRARGASNIAQRSIMAKAGASESSEDERDMIVRQRRSPRLSKRRRELHRESEDDDSAGPNNDGPDVGNAQDLDHLAALRNGFALEIRDLRTAAGGTFARSSFAIVSGTNATRLAEAKRFGLTLLRVLVSLSYLCVAWSWSWAPLVIRRPLERRLWRPVRRRARRVLRWVLLKLPRYLRLLWHGREGEARRRAAILMRASETARTARDRSARFVPSTSSSASSATVAAGTRTTAAGGENEATSGLAREVALRKAMRVVSPATGSQDKHFWRAFLAPDAPDAADEDSDEDGEWLSHDDAEDDDDEADDDLDDVTRDEGADVSVEGQVQTAGIASQLAARARRLRMRSPFSDDDDFIADEDEDFDEGTSLALALAAQRRQNSGAAVAEDAELGADMPQYLVMHLSHNGASPLTRTRYRQLVGDLDRPGPSAHSATAAPTASTSAVRRLWTSSTSRHHDGLANDRDVLVDVIQTRREMALRTLAQSGDGNAALLRGSAQDDEQRAEWERERQRLCVICQTENRTILIWPCRCLALCEDCRDNLASRPVAGKVQTCPCCRTAVAGFSRLFLP